MTEKHDIGCIMYANDSTSDKDMRIKSLFHTIEKQNLQQI